MHQLENRPSVSVEMALAFLKQRIADSHFRLENLAKAVHLSRSHLSRILKKETGVGFREHLRNLRFECARAALRDGELSIKEIAAHCGFNSTSSFDHEFRRAHGCSPTEWRRATYSKRSDHNN